MTYRFWMIAINKLLSKLLIRAIATLGLSSLAACVGASVEGPNYPAEEAPFIATGHGATILPLEIHHRLILIGDAGLYLENDPTLTALGQWSQAHANSTVLFLGDNIYHDGLIEKQRREAERILAQQLSATPVLKVVIPGNHDWGVDPAEQDIAAIRNQQTFVDDWPQGNTRFAPRDGCMGPEKIVLSEASGKSPALVLLVLDPTPFLVPRLREFCPSDLSDEAHFAALDALLELHVEDYVVVASHYPMTSGGPHGGMSHGLLEDIVVGVYGWFSGRLGDIDEPEYAQWIARTEKIFRRNPPLIYAAGHDHSLQIIESGGEVGLHIVSGAGAPNRVSPVTNIPATLFAHAAPGFVVVDIGQRGSEPAVVVRVVENGFERPVFEMNLVVP